MIYILIVIFLTVSHSFSADAQQNVQALKVFSIQITSDLLGNELRNNKMIITQNLNIPMQKLKNCKAIGSISKIDMQGSQDLQFYFTYNLNVWSTSLQITIFARPQHAKKLSDKLAITLDFLIAEFPTSYFIFTYNITSYQTHIEHQTTREYELIFLLNGFNNFSKSGNFTHSYQLGYGIYTVHYMSCEGEEGNMGWREDVDYNLFTLMVVPMKGLIQKFKIQEKSYSVDEPEGFKYFYGLKGATDDQFVGGFQKRLGGLIFKTKHLSNTKTYGLVFLPYPSNGQIIDKRADSSLSNFQIIGISAFVLILTLVVFYVLCQRCYFLKRMVKWKQDDYELQESQGTKTDLKNSKVNIARPKYEVNTVEQVQQKYQSSRKSSRKSSFKSKANEIPSLKFNQ